MRPVQFSTPADLAQESASALSGISPTERRSYVMRMAEELVSGNDLPAVVIGGYRNLPKLTERQMEALERLNVKPTCEVQREMGISAKTMESHKREINREFGTEDYRDALPKARAMGIVPYTQEE